MLSTPPPSVPNRDGLLAALDKEISTFNEAQKYDGWTHQALIVALCAVLLLLAEVWEAGSIRWLNATRLF